MAADMNDKDIELKLLAGMPIEIDIGLYAHAPTLRDIVQIGESKYNQYLSSLLFDKSSIEGAEEQFSEFEYLYLVSYHNKPYREVLLDGINFLFKGKPTFEVHGQEDIICKVGDSGIINKYNFSLVKRIVKMQSCLDGVEESKGNPSNEKARQLLEKQKLLKQKVAKAKNRDGDGDPLSILDLISILASNANYNLINNVNNPMSVWNLTMFQFNNAFNRLKILKDYEVNVQALIHGAKSEEVQMKHWMSKIDKT